MKRSSVVMANYNDSKYLGASLEAVLAQTLAPFEIVIVDHASTDESMEVLQKFARSNSTIRMLRNETNQGVLPTFKRGIEEARGEFVYCAPPTKNSCRIPSRNACRFLTGIWRFKFVPS